MIQQQQSQNQSYVLSSSPSPSQSPSQSQSQSHALQALPSPLLHTLTPPLQPVMLSLPVELESQYPVLTDILEQFNGFVDPLESYFNGDLELNAIIPSCPSRPYHFRFFDVTQQEYNNFVIFIMSLSVTRQLSIYSYYEFVWSKAEQAVINQKLRLPSLTVLLNSSKTKLTNVPEPHIKDGSGIKEYNHKLKFILDTAINWYEQMFDSLDLKHYVDCRLERIFKEILEINPKHLLTDKMQKTKNDVFLVRHLNRNVFKESGFRLGNNNIIFKIRQKVNTWQDNYGPCSKPLYYDPPPRSGEKCSDCNVDMVKHIAINISAMPIIVRTCEYVLKDNEDSLPQLDSEYKQDQTFSSSFSSSMQVGRLPTTSSSSSSSSSSYLYQLSQSSPQPEQTVISVPPKTNTDGLSQVLQV